MHMKRNVVEKTVFKKCAKKWLALLSAVLAFSAYTPAGSYVYAAEEQEESEHSAEESEETTENTEAQETSGEGQDAVSEETSEANSSEESASEESSDAAADAQTNEDEASGSAEDTTASDAEEMDGTQEGDGETQPEEDVNPEETMEEEGTEEDPFADPNALDLDGLMEKEGMQGKEIQLEEVSEEEEEYEEAIYDGIVIDGKFSDWDGVSKTDAGGTSDYQDFVEAVAVFQDGDYIYVYIRDTGIGAAAWSGPHGNGQYSLVTDLGYSVLFQLHATDNGSHVSISGVNGAECAYYTKGWGYSGEWEISIPVSELPYSRGSFAFGYYQADPFIGEVADQREKDETTGNTTGEGSDGQDEELIIFDGMYGDWSSYPHTLIHYATSGTWEKYVDGEGALYTAGNNLYGHVVTRMGAHLTEHGEEMQYGVVLRINQDNNLWFEFRLIDVDANGRINWNVNVADQENGTHEYYIVDTRGWSNAATLEDITQGNNIYGRMRITKGDISDEAEWKLDLGLIAEHFGLEETDLQVLEVRYERIGDKWLQTAGASTGPVAGILLSMAAAGSVMVLQRRKKVN